MKNLIIRTTHEIAVLIMLFAFVLWVFCTIRYTFGILPQELLHGKFILMCERGAVPAEYNTRCEPAPITRDPTIATHPQTKNHK